MDRLAVIRRVRQETACSPEFRYLASWDLEEARAVFGEVEVVELPGTPDSPALSPRGEAALALDPRYACVLFLADDVLLGRRSLARMRRLLEEGCDVACPAPLAGMIERQAPVYTLRGFERVEARALAEKRGGAPPGQHLPVSLWRLAALERAAPGLALRTLAAAAAPAFSAAAPGLAWGTAGIYHQFIDYYAEVRDDILPLVPPGTREVLEIGCGRGVTGKLLRDRLGCRVTGVELNPVAARTAAENLDAVLCGDVESLDIPGRYDLVLGLELFEHLTEQEEFLARMRRLLQPGGSLLLSVPNVGHYSVVEDLLAGRWDYLPIGLLCFTHYRFFTRHTLDHWLRRCGFGDVTLLPQRTELPPGLAALAGNGSDLEVDLDSLATRGFYVLAR